MTTYARVTRAWNGQEWVDDALVAIGEQWIRAVPETVVAGSVARLRGTLLPPLTDAHVHIGLSDFPSRGGGALARMLDLGWDPDLLSPLMAKARNAFPATEVLTAGTFLTAPGGYPTGRVWAPPSSVTALPDAEAAADAVRARQAAGCAVVKVTLNLDAGPVLRDEVLSAIVRAAREVGLPVVAHVEGAGQAQRAWRAGVDAFAHTPWTERLSDADLAGMATDVVWISTLDMHGRGRYGDGFATALDNLTRFAAAGGAVVYGTDLGNAITTTDLNLREVAGLRAAGVTGEGLLRALTATGLLRPWSRTATFVPEVVGDADAVIDALPTSRPVDSAALRERLS